MKCPQVGVRRAGEECQDQAQGDDKQRQGGRGRPRAQEPGARPGPARQAEVQEGDRGPVCAADPAQVQQLGRVQVSGGAVRW